MTPEIPEDFDAFWQRAVAEAMSVRLDYHRDLEPADETETHRIETFSFRTVQDRELQGWIAIPPDARRLPGFLWVPPYGRESLLPDAYGTREGFVSLSFNFHGHAAFHQEKYVPARGYFAEGAEDPESWIFRRMFQDAVVAARVLQSLIEVDEDRIGSMGMSQGGGISIWLGAHCPIIRAVCADMPFLGRVRETLDGNVYRYPLKEIADYIETLPVGRERVGNTLAYYDTSHQATRCKVPAQVSLGLKDPAARPDTVRVIFDALPGPKMLRTYDWGHDWHPEMVENNRTWLKESFR